MAMRFTAIALMMLMVAGCQYGYPVRAERQGDDYVLTSPDRDGHFAPHPCVRQISVYDQGRVIWRIENPARGWPNEGGECERTDFPLFYGRPPPGFTTIVEAEPLRPGGRYVIAGEGVARYHGAFSIRADLTVDNDRKYRPGLDPRLTSR